MASATLALAPRRATPALVVVGFNAVVLALVLAGYGTVGIALVIAVPALLAIVQRPQRGLLLLAALAPFSGLLLILPTPWFAKAWKEALTALTLGATFLAPARARGAPGRRLPGWAPAIAGLGVLGLVSAIAIGGLQAAVGLKVGFFYVLAAVAAWRCPLSARERDRLITIIMGAGIVTSLVGLAQQVLGADRLHQLGYEYNTAIRFSGSFLRSFSTFNQPFGFGFFVALSLLIGAPQALTDPRRPRNQLFLLATPVLGLGLLSTFVRGAWFALGVGVMYLASRRYRILLLLIPAALLVIAFLPTDISASAFSSSSSQQRTESWVSHAGVVVVHPLGIGIGATGSASEKVNELRGDRSSVYQPDNYYFKVIMELGPLGLWFLILLLVGAFRSSRAMANQLTGSDAALADGVAAGVLAAAAGAMVATYFEIFPMDLFFWLLLAVVATCDPVSS